MEEISYDILQPVAGAIAPAPADLARLGGVPLELSVELGRTRVTIAETLALVPGAIIPLDRTAGEPVDILVNGRPIGRGEVVVVDEEFGVRLTEILGPGERAESP